MLSYLDLELCFIFIQLNERQPAEGNLFSGLYFIYGHEYY